MDAINALREMAKRFAEEKARVELLCDTLEGAEGLMRKWGCPLSEAVTLEAKQRAFAK
jgi:hypothetical protein